MTADARTSSCSRSAGSASTCTPSSWACRFSDVQTFRKSIGGTATNVAVACARLGHRTAVFTRVGDDPFGRVRAATRSSTRSVSTPASSAPIRRPADTAGVRRTGARPRIRRIIFYREPKAPDMNIAAAEVDRDVVATVPVLWFTTSCLSRRAEPRDDPRAAVDGAIAAAHRVRSRLAAALLARSRQPRRPSSTRCSTRSRWRSATAPSARSRSGRVGSRPRPPTAARPWPRGGHRQDGRRRRVGGDADGTRERVAPYPVEVVCGLGAGDAFGGTLCHGLLSGWDLVRIVRVLATPPVRSWRHA